MPAVDQHVFVQQHTAVLYQQFCCLIVYVGLDRFVSVGLDLVWSNMLSGALLTCGMLHRGCCADLNTGKEEARCRHAKSREEHSEEEKASSAAVWSLFWV